LRRITLASHKEAILLARHKQELNFPDNFWRKPPTTTSTKLTQHFWRRNMQTHGQQTPLFTFLLIDSIHSSL
jgi:hypothetical protein